MKSHHAKKNRESMFGTSWITAIARANEVRGTKINLTFEPSGTNYAKFLKFALLLRPIIA